MKFLIEIDVEPDVFVDHESIEERLVAALSNSTAADAISEAVQGTVSMSLLEDATRLLLAPELIETLEDVHEWLTTCMIDGVGFDEPQIIEAITAVLAKATK